MKHKKKLDSSFGKMNHQGNYTRKFILNVKYRNFLMTSSKSIVCSGNVCMELKMRNNQIF